MIYLPEIKQVNYSFKNQIMAKGVKKVVTENTEVTSEINEPEVNQENEIEQPEIVEEEKEVELPVSVQDIPAQMQDTSVSKEPKGVTEIEFLQRILNIQHTGGFGRHLDEIIYERIKRMTQDSLRESWVIIPFQSL